MKGLTREQFEQERNFLSLLEEPTEPVRASDQLRGIWLFPHERGDIHKMSDAPVPHKPENYGFEFADFARLAEFSTDVMRARLHAADFFSRIKPPRALPR